MRELVAVAAFAAALASPAAATPSARFSEISYTALAERETPEGHYRNPVLPGFQPDPSIVRVGEDFYLVNSTFAWFPGIPVYHSRDLVNWRLIGHAIDRPGQLDFSGLGTNRGVFAPAIEWHGGRFYILNTCIECGGNFVVTAERPEGPWSDPVWLDFEGIDPSLFVDEDGTAWIVNNGAPQGEPRYEGHRSIWIQRFDLETLRMTGPRKVLVESGVHPQDEPVWAEGPHVYRVGDWYYLTAAEGGTAEDHSQTIYRSRHPDGPYEPGPINPVLTQRNLPRDRPDRIEATGHADLVQLPDGSWWGVFLATRPFAGQSTLLGRETFLLPVTWRDGWPLFLDPGAPVPPVAGRPPLPPSPPATWEHWIERFDGETLSAEWIRIRTPGMVQDHSLDRTDTGLMLIPGADTAGTLGAPAFLGRRLRHPAAQVTASVDFAPASAGQFAGLLAFMDEHHFLAFGVEGTDEGRRLTARRRIDGAQGDRGEIVAMAPLTASGPVELELTIDGGSAGLRWRASGEGWQVLARHLDIEPLASVHAGLFTGLVIGPYAVSGPAR